MQQSGYVVLIWVIFKRTKVSFKLAALVAINTLAAYMDQPNAPPTHLARLADRFMAFSAASPHTRCRSATV
jgi:hypothetical protein